MRAIYLASVWLHVLAAMTWTGGMVLFVAAVMPYFRRRSDEERTAFLEWFGARFAVVAWVCFAALVATGSFNLWMRGVRPADFLRADWRHTSFGSLAIIKLSLVALAVAISAAHERITARAYARWMGRSLLLLALAIVGVAVMLVRAI
jgi:copper resistance protein D